MKWVTRERPKTDRIACPWLIRKFIDPEPEFLYVPAEHVPRWPSATGPPPTTRPTRSTGTATGSGRSRCSSRSTASTIRRYG